MKISEIKQQVKNQGRYSIFVDGKYTFSLCELALINSAIRIGQELSKQELDDLKDKSRFDKSYNRVLALIARRQRSEWEVRDYLRRKDESEYAEEILNKLSDLGYINDKAFAESWVNTRRLLKAISKRRLQQELRAKHIASDIVDEVLEADETDEHTVLKELIEKKQRISRYRDDPQKLMQFLIRQGFNYAAVKAAMNNTDPDDF